ncbi:serine hydrolase domain-containing protein [Crystallibacter degradans]|uniref:serine hydrolase domain-containing protein n=1 Tax=Crystallibacter degradans TaxID=2726743 RepID=UPI00147668B7|nr:serine hydrolase domain-containing protein [Arthrobacter sp. SF27]NMR31604.1 beta-lactamase family protein [Arthrobacter sp. SF27]
MGNIRERRGRTPFQFPAAFTLACAAVCVLAVGICFAAFGIWPAVTAAGSASFGTGEPTDAPEPGRGPPDRAFAAVDAYLQEQIDAMEIPAVAIAIIKDGRPVHQAAFGSADDSGRPMTAQTPVLLASTSKSLTAIAVMQQVEAGRLELDEPVLTYLPWFSMRDSRAAAITVRHLLHQTSGLSTADGSAFGASDTQDPDALEQGVRDLADASLVSDPGERFTYSNANYNILGLLVQTVSGQPFGDYMQDHVFVPLDMANSHTTRAAARADSLAAGYSLWFGAWWRQTDVPAAATGMPSTTMYSSAQDLGHELTALLDGGVYLDRRILRPESVETLLTPRVRVDESKRYAMAWFARPLLESTSPDALPQADGDLPLLLEHQGEWGNTHTYQALVPSSGLGLALLINGNDTSAPSRLQALDSNVLRILHGQPPQPLTAQEDWLQQYGWAVALGLLFAEVASLALALRVLAQKRTGPRSNAAPRRGMIILWTVAAMALDAFLIWLAFVYAPARFETYLAVIIHQFPDVGATLVPALTVAIVCPLPRTAWLLSRLRRPSPPLDRTTSRIYS